MRTRSTPWTLRSGMLRLFARSTTALFAIACGSAASAATMARRERS
jgi:hypothetical protein